MKSKKILSLLVSLSILCTNFLSIAPNVQAATVKNIAKNNIIAKSINRQNFSVSISPFLSEVRVMIKSLDGSSHNYAISVYFYNNRHRYVGNNLVGGSGAELDKFISPNNEFVRWASASVSIDVDGETLTAETVYN